MTHCNYHILTPSAPYIILWIKTNKKKAAKESTHTNKQSMYDGFSSPFSAPGESQP